jgi:thymidylate kinase
MTQKGKMIVLYGINNIGKSTQGKEIAQRLRELGLEVIELKYPLYELEPEGPFINRYLRDAEFRAANPKTTHELQEFYMRNRERYQPELEALLESGTWIVAEDYIWTGIAWGLAWGGDFYYLQEINQHLYEEDLAILMDGDRFMDAVESNHRNESDVSRITICKNFFRLLADRNKWSIINANNKEDEVSDNIWRIISVLLKKEGII